MDGALSSEEVGMTSVSLRGKARKLSTNRQTTGYVDYFSCALQTKKPRLIFHGKLEVYEDRIVFTSAVFGGIEEMYVPAEIRTVEKRGINSIVIELNNKHLSEALLINFANRSSAMRTIRKTFPSLFLDDNTTSDIHSSDPSKHDGTGQSKRQIPTTNAKALEIGSLFTNTTMKTNNDERFPSLETETIEEKISEHVIKLEELGQVVLPVNAETFRARFYEKPNQIDNATGWNEEGKRTVTIQLVLAKETVEVEVIESRPVIVEGKYVVQGLGKIKGLLIDLDDHIYFKAVTRCLFASFGGVTSVAEQGEEAFDENVRLSVQEALKERTKKRLTAIAKFVGVIAEIEDLESSAEHPSLYALSKMGGQRSDSSMLRSMDGYETPLSPTDIDLRSHHGPLKNSSADGFKMDDALSEEKPTDALPEEKLSEEKPTGALLEEKPTGALSEERPTKDQEQVGTVMPPSFEISLPSTISSKISLPTERTESVLRPMPSARSTWEDKPTEDDGGVLSILMSPVTVYVTAIVLLIMLFILFILLLRLNALLSLQITLLMSVASHYRS